MKGSHFKTTLSSVKHSIVFGLPSGGNPRGLSELNFSERIKSSSWRVAARHVDFIFDKFNYPTCVGERINFADF